MKSPGAVLTLLGGLLSATAAGAQDVTLYSGSTRHCEARAVAHTQWRTLRLRLTKPDERALTCALDREETLALLGRGLTALRDGVPDAAGYESVFLGRIIDYAWLSRHLAEAAARDANWASASGKTQGGEGINALVQRLLAAPEVLDPVNEVAKTSGYRVAGWSCEKVLVSGPDTTEHQPDWIDPTKRLPFDAMCWLKLESA